jgi:hypothetical protein
MMIVILLRKKFKGRTFKDVENMEQIKIMVFQ